VMPGLQYERPNGFQDTQALNNSIVAYRDSCSHRFPVALGTVELLHGRSRGRYEIERLVSELSIDGVVWHTRFQGVALSDPRMHDLVAHAASLNLPCFVHLFAESTLEA